MVVVAAAAAAALVVVLVVVVAVVVVVVVVLVVVVNRSRRGDVVSRGGTAVVVSLEDKSSSSTLGVDIATPAGRNLWPGPGKPFMGTMTAYYTTIYKLCTKKEEEPWVWAGGQPRGGPPEGFLA